MNYLKKLNYLVLLIIFVLIFTISIQAEESMTLGVTAKMIGLSKLDSWQTILDEVSKRSGINIELTVAKDHFTLLDLMREEKIDLAYLSPIFYAKARQEFNAVPIVLEKRLDSSYYRGGFIVHKNSKIEDLKDLRGKNLALTAEKDSTSGYYLPITTLKKEGMDYQQDLNVVFTGKHINVLKSVSYGLVDAGAIKLFILEDPENAKFKSEIKIIWKSPRLPTSSITARPEMELEKIEKLEAAFLSLNDDRAGQEAIEKSGFDGFAKSNDQMYDIIRDYILDFEN
ncbi:MAG: phosphate/phosphite/phosphonate ABC transporter substrate-binding protein [Halanaerobiales bacterium]